MFLRSLAVLIALSPPLWADGATSLTPLIFTCERGVVLPVTFVNTASGDSFAIMQIEGRQIALGQRVSGSGARYHALDEATPYALHSKGAEAMVFYGPEAGSEILLRDCRAE